MMTVLEKNLLATLCWFDLFRQPLTPFECWQFLWDEKSLTPSVTWREVNLALEALAEKKLVKTDRGFWQLNDTPVYAAERLARSRWSLAKRRRAEQAAKLIMYLPFTRWVALANTLAFGSTRPESDIDLFIVVKGGRLYLSRLLITLLLQLLGWRRHGRKIADRICLSFYVTDDYLNLKPLTYADDPYFVFWLGSLNSLVNTRTAAEFFQANRWLSQYTPNSLAAAPIKPTAFTAQGFKLVAEKILSGSLGQMLEVLARKLQLTLMKRHRHSRLGDGTTAVVVTKSVLKFHESDQRQQLAERFRQRQREVLVG